LLFIKNQRGIKKAKDNVADNRQPDIEKYNGPKAHVVLIAAKQLAFLLALFKVSGPRHFACGAGSDRLHLAP